MSIRTLGSLGVLTAFLLIAPVAEATYSPFKHAGMGSAYLEHDAIAMKGYTDNVIALFKEIGENPAAFSAGVSSLDDVDMTRLMNHRCYGVVGNEWEPCTKEFGPYADLKEIKHSGRLLAILTGEEYTAPTPVASADEIHDEKYMEAMDNVHEENVSEVLALFQKQGYEDITNYNNTAIEEGDVDLRPYVTHTCFEVVGYKEEIDCEQQFGSYAPLNETMANGNLLNLLLAHQEYTDAAKAKLVQQIGFQAMEVKRPEEEAEHVVYQKDSRSHLLWTACGYQYGKWGQQSCYQRNHRLLYSDVSIVKHLHMEEKQMYIYVGGST